jgi:hypothetical protein
MTVQPKQTKTKTKKPINDKMSNEETAAAGKDEVGCQVSKRAKKPTNKTSDNNLLACGDDKVGH